MCGQAQYIVVSVQILPSEHKVPSGDRRMRDLTYAMVRDSRFPVLSL
jgi:hypothetical protein